MRHIVSKLCLERGELSIDGVALLPMEVTAISHIKRHLKIDGGPFYFDVFLIEPKEAITVECQHKCKLAEFRRQIIEWSKS